MRMNVGSLGVVTNQRSSLDMGLGVERLRSRCLMATSGENGRSELPDSAQDSPRSPTDRSCPPLQTTGSRDLHSLWSIGSPGVVGLKVQRRLSRKWPPSRRPRPPVHIQQTRNIRTRAAHIARARRGFGYAVCVDLCVLIQQHLHVAVGRGVEVVDEFLGLLIEQRPWIGARHQGWQVDFNGPSRFEPRRMGPGTRSPPEEGCIPAAEHKMAAGATGTSGDGPL